MKTRSLLLLLSLTILSAITFAQQLIPIPAEMQMQGGSYRITAASVVSYNVPAAQAAAKEFSDRLSIPAGFTLPVQAGSSGPVRFILLEKKEKRIGNEGYLLTVTADGITLSANAPAGLYYGVQTLLQLLPADVEGSVLATTEWSIPAVTIVDKPRFGWRGLMLDVSRHFFPVEDVKMFIRQMARYKYNTLHWHLTDDNGWRIEVKAYPKLTSVGAWRVERSGAFGSRLDPQPGEASTYGGFYTQEQIKEIVQYAVEHHITVIPEIDLPGHSMAAIAAYPWLSTKKDTNTRVNPGSDFADWFANGTFKMNIENTLNPSDEKVYQFLEKVFAEVAPLFPAPYFHVGGDEAYKGYWMQDSGCQALMKKLNIRHVEDLQGYFITRLETMLKKHNKKLLGWDEILEGGVSPSAAVMSWRGMKRGIEAAEKGHEVVMAPTTFAYLDYNQGDQTIDPPVYASLRAKKTYSFDPMPEGVDPKYILGGQGNLWTENIPHMRAVQYMLYPRAWALSEVLWSPKEKKDWNSFTARMEEHFRRADRAGINYSTAVFDAVIRTRMNNGMMTVEMESEMPGVDIHYTIDETMPDERSPKYSAPFTLPPGPVTLRAVTYRNGAPAGHLIILKPEELQKRAGR